MKPGTPPLQPVRADSLVDRTLQSIREAIFTGHFEPGAQLRELHLAASLKVSQATVREALARLERSGLVVRLPNRRTTVTAFSPEEVAQRLQIRLVLEELAAVQAAARATKADLARLKSLNEAINEAVAAGDHYRNVLADMEFHRAIWSLAGNPVLYTMLDELTTPLFAYLAAVHTSGKMDLRTTRPHSRIVDAIRSQDETRVRAEIRAHIERSYTSFLAAPDL